MSIRHAPRFRLVKLFGSILAFVLAVSLFGIAAAVPATPSKNTLSLHNRELLNQALAGNSGTVTVLIASKEGMNNSVANAVTQAKGKILYQDNDISYIRATVPSTSVQALAANANVTALDIDEVLPIGDPQPDGTVPPTPQTPPSASTPNNNPYMPTGDTGASQFVAAHPTWDGRGVTVGILDTGLSLDHPSLLTTSTGERKVVDWVTFTDPFTDNDPTWLNMQDSVSGATFTYQAVTYTAPANGTYRISLFNERDPRLGGEIGNDVNRDGNPTGSSGLFAVIWDLTSGKIWVDTNQNHSFTDELGMLPYKQNFDVGTFGTDNPATPVREAMPFVVQSDLKTHVVNIGIVAAQHGSHVSGIIAGNQLFGGAMSGAAPGAKIVSVRVCLFIAGCTSHALIEGMIYAAKNSHVDVINMSIGGLPSLNDGNNARAELYDRLIRIYNVQMFISAGNSGPGLNTIGDPSVATTVMSVGAYITKATWQSNYGSDTTLVDNMHPFSSRGPREDGGFKPNIIAPGAAVSTTPLWQPGGPVLGTYTLPPGYSMLNGTSMAAPQATGGAALLISAAKQTGVMFQPPQLRQAINSSARLLNTTRFQVYEQGNGLLDVGAAWNLLSTNIKDTQISSSVPVNTLLSGFLKTPGFGVGIYDREGVTAGQTYTRQYMLTRTKGGNTPTTFVLQWVGNDGTFSSQSTIKLPKGTPTALNVTVHPTTAGAHSAILNIDDPTTVGVDYQTMNVVIAANEFNAGNNYSVTNSGTVGRNNALHFFYRIPANTPAFKVDFSGPSATPGTGQARFLTFHPYGVGIESNASTSCYLPSAGSCVGSPSSRTIVNPLAGVWELTVEARRTSDIDPVPFTLTASILGASVSPNPDTIASATIGTPIARSYTLTNLFGAFTGRAVGTSLGSAKIETPSASIGVGVTRPYPIVVTAGSTSLRATIGGTSDAGADLDLYVDNCTGGPCVQVGSSADGDSEESVTINNPAAGNWQVRVVGFAIPSGNTTYNYVDVFANAAFGSVSVTDANAVRPSGASWTVPGSVVANSAPASGRVLLGNVQVRTDTNILVGSGDVVVQSVSP